MSSEHCLYESVDNDTLKRRIFDSEDDKSHVSEPEEEDHSFMSRWLISTAPMSRCTVSAVLMSQQAMSAAPMSRRTLGAVLMSQQNDERHAHEMVDDERL